MKCDKTIIRAIETACDKLTQAEVSRQVGVSHQAIQQIRNGSIGSCRDEVWSKLWPVLVEHGGLELGDPEYWPRDVLVSFVNQHGGR